MERVFTAVFTDQHNPWYFHGAIPTVLFWVLVVTGILLWFYYMPTLRDAYSSVAFITDPGRHPFGWLIRGLHRYGADAMMVAALLHMFKVYFTDRHRGIRHMVWLSGVLLLGALWIVGLTGYLLVWDERALLMTNASVEILGWLPFIGDGLARFFIGGSEITDFTLTRFLFLHVGIPTLMFFLLWWHFVRITKPVVTTSYSMTLLTLGIILVSTAIWPAENLPAADISAPATSMPIDWFYLFGFWLLARVGAGGVWLITFVILGALFAAPYFPRLARTNTAMVNAEKCTGCTFCAIDCPYQAITMAIRPPEDQTSYKEVAVVMDERCVECGICVGSCPFDAIDLPQQTAEQYSQQIEELIAADTSGPVQAEEAYERN
jgi:quinol-cytochrome oxidoreductase complex cytochrome b subunit